MAGQIDNVSLVAANFSRLLHQQEEEKNLDWMKNEKARAPGNIDVW
jgi:hypothetical protein